ncbi:hypothetical protein NMY22_g9682 [Coprinellus aureogranulatus]|nr:hypothetical protein NMY22_g9682 [Coprinellus aureogranulatus]
MPPVTLCSLPAELLAKVAGDLSLDDLLQFRAVCRSVNRACGARQVWKELFSKSLGVSIPKPFFLPKPIDECSSKELERALRRWDAPWLPAVDVQTVTRDVETAPLTYPRFRADTLVMAPGGRWGLVCHYDGSIWYFDLSQDLACNAPLVPRILVPLPGDTTPADRYRAGARRSVVLAVDWTSPDALGLGTSSHFLTQFRIAVFTNHRTPTLANVWSVQVREGPTGTMLCLGERLSSFEMGFHFFPTYVSLYGPTIAYDVWKGRVHILDWRAANRKKAKDPLYGQCIAEDRHARDFILTVRLSFVAFLLLLVFTSSILKSIHILPGSRILISYYSPATVFSLHNTEKDYPLSNLNILDRDSVGSPSHSPIWRFSSPTHYICFATQQPFVIRNAVQMILPTQRTLYGLTVKLDDYSVKGVQLDPLVKCYFSTSYPARQAFHLNRAVGLLGSHSDLNELFFSQYSWTGKYAEEHVSSAFRKMENPLGELRHSNTTWPGNCLLDVFTNRVLIPNNHGTRFYTVFATQYTSDGQKEAPNRIAISLDGELIKEDAEADERSTESDSSSQSGEGLWD